MSHGVVPLGGSEKTRPTYSLNLNVRDPHARHRAAMPACLAEALAPLLLEDAELRPARLAVDDANHLRVGDKRRAGDDVARVLLDEQHLLEGELLARFTCGSVDLDDGSRSDLDLAAARLDDRVHEHLSIRPNRACAKDLA